MNIELMEYHPPMIERHCYACRELIDVNNTWQITCFTDYNVEFYYSHCECIDDACARILRYRLAS